MNSGHENTQAWVGMARDYMRAWSDKETEWKFDALIGRIARASELAAKWGMEHIIWGMLRNSIWRGLSMDIAIQTDGSGLITELTRLMTAYSVDGTDLELWELVGGCEAGRSGRDFGVWTASPEGALYHDAAEYMKGELSRYSEHVLGVLQWGIEDGVMGTIRKEVLQSYMDDTSLMFQTLLELAPPMQMIPLCGIFYRHLHSVKRVKVENSEEFGKVAAIIAGIAKDMLLYCGDDL